MTNEDQLKALRKLHRETRKPDPAKVAVRKGSKGLDLSYLGHADTTDLLLIHDPAWNWEPVAWTEKGQPAVQINKEGWPVGLWIKLTVHGVTRLGYGSCAPGKEDAVKELIGDAIRNAAMRFGVALQLWSKADADGWGDLPEDDADDDDDDTPPAPADSDGAAATPAVNSPLAADSQPEAKVVAGRCPECNGPTADPGPRHGTGCSRRQLGAVPQEVEAAAAALDATVEEVEEDEAQPPLRQVKEDIGRWMKAMAPAMAERYVTYKRVNHLPDNLKDASEEKLRMLHAWLSAQPVARVVEAGAGQA